MTYYYRLKGMTTYCEFGDDLNERLLDQLLAGTKDTAIRLEVFKKNLDMDGTLAHARAVISARKQANSMSKQGQQVSSEASPIVNKIFHDKKQWQPQQQQQQANACDYCGKSHAPRSCPAFGKICTKCGRDNHYAVVCKNGQNKAPDGYNSGGSSRGRGGRGRGRGNFKSRAVKEEEETLTETLDSFERHMSRGPYDD
jgi:hypothetical protein